MFCLIAFTSPAHATPVEPSLQEILAHPPTPSAPFPPARAGWNGPETPPSPQVAPHPILQTFGVEAQKRQFDQALRGAATPNPLALAAILTAILVLRRTREEPAKPQAVPRKEVHPMAA